MIRTHTAGSLRPEHAGEQVVLAGWVARRRDHGGVTFIDLRDASGLVQVVFREEEAHHLRAEYCIAVRGTVSPRPAGNENPDLATGRIEVTAEELTVLSEAAPLPFPIDEHVEVGEEVRLKYRYLDLRRNGPAHALRVRSQLMRVMREVMYELDFVDVETPYMTRSTPEGARDFIVPVRLRPGSWYALPQSPQLFKQLLMVGGLERYFQIARCFRDEDFRADRQPEFTQLDLEMSFVDEEDVYAVGERVFATVMREVAAVEVPTPFPRMTYAEAMRRFGTDKPDLRYGCELVDLTEYFAGTEFAIFQARHVGAVVMPGGAAQSRKQLDGWQEWARSHGAKGLAYVLVEESGLRGPIVRHLSEQHQAGLPAAVGARPGDCVFFAADTRPAALGLLAAARQEIAKRCGLIPEGRWDFAWITEMPMFEPDEDGGWTAVHHPFCQPAGDDFDVHPDTALARAYDLVLNGWEVVSGSIRIHRTDVQQRVFDVIGLSKEQAEAQFGFLLEAFQYGPPPHGGLAVGLDRVAALLAGHTSIREVIAFPKTGGGHDPLTGAPAPITAAQRREAGVDVIPDESTPRVIAEP